MQDPHRLDLHVSRIQYPVLHVFGVPACPASQAARLLPPRYISLFIEAPMNAVWSSVPTADHP